MANINPSNRDADRNVSTPSASNDYDVQTTAHGRPATREEVAYRNGYTEAQLREQNRWMRMHNHQRSQSDNTPAGILIGLLLASALGIIIGGFYWASQTDDVIVPVLDPQPTEPENAAPNVTERNTTVIERTVDRAQEVVPAEPPNVQITLPEAQSETDSAPQETAPADSGTTAGTTENSPAGASSSNTPSSTNPQ